MCCGGSTVLGKMWFKRSKVTVVTRPKVVKMAEPYTHQWLSFKFCCKFWFATMYMQLCYSVVHLIFFTLWFMIFFCIVAEDNADVLWWPKIFILMVTLWSGKRNLVMSERLWMPLCFDILFVILPIPNSTNSMHVTWMQQNYVMKYVF